MATVYVIHAEADAPSVRRRLLRVLPSNGYDYWLSSHHLAGAGLEYAIAPSMDRCQSVLIVLSPALAESEVSPGEIDAAIAGRHMPIVVQVEVVGEQDSARLPEKLSVLPRIDLALEGEEADRLLASLLPPAGFEPGAEVPGAAERIAWDVKIFSDALDAATARHDHASAAALVEAFVGHLAHRSDRYPPESASGDLSKLRQEREFVLMCRYAQGVIDFGTWTDKILRLYSQALIETGEYDRALGILQSIIGHPGSSQFEIYEAHGLIGRIFKQRYMNAPDAEGAAALLRHAVEAYETAYEEKRDKNFWHGVNAASCMLRAERDGNPVAPPGRAQEIARQILADLDELERGGPLDVWDYATKVEALLALERYDEAERALDMYINHPGMRAFEVSSTYRQFDQVLQLGREPRGWPILARLREATERYRAGRAVSRPPGRAAEPDSEPPRTKPLVIRLGDPDWEPKGVAGLVIQSRLGKIVTARGSDASVRELLADPTVISVEESRPAGRIECARSLPFINAVTQAKPNPAATYTERGECALIAVIDDGIDVLHEAFLDAEGKSRIVGIWNQNSSDGAWPKGFSYGTFHDAQAVAGYVASGLVPPSLGRDPDGHGTHVASIAAGRAAGNFPGGVAPDARLLVVVSGAGGQRGYDVSNIEALDFIDSFAAELGMPVVVNVSQGKNAGAHDGKSSIEGSFNAFSKSGTRPGRVIVKSAGNERNKYGHAYVTLGSDGLERLRWRRQPGADITERIELWWNSDHDLEFRLGEPVRSVDPPLEPAPPADWSKWVNTAAPVCNGVFQNGGPYRLTFTKHHNDNGDSLLEIVLGIDQARAGYGDWLLEIRSGNLLSLCEIHCWIERSQGLPTIFKSHADENMTLTIPGTAQYVITVGAVDACRPLVVGDSSSYGPTRVKHFQPLVCAPGVNVNAARAGTSNDVIAKCGTSMAAPHVTGALALLLSKAAKAGKTFGANQVATLLRQKAQNYNASWDRGRGYGVIDVAALLATVI